MRRRSGHDQPSWYGDMEFPARSGRSSLTRATAVPGPYRTVRSYAGHRSARPIPDLRQVGQRCAAASPIRTFVALRSIAQVLKVSSADKAAI